MSKRMISSEQKMFLVVEVYDRLNQSQKEKFATACAERVILWAGLNEVAIDERSVQAIVATERRMGDAIGFSSYDLAIQGAYDATHKARVQMSLSSQPANSKSVHQVAVAKIAHDFIAKVGTPSEHQPILVCARMLGEKEVEWQLDRVRSLVAEQKRDGG